MDESPIARIGPTWPNSTPPTVAYLSVDIPRVIEALRMFRDAQLEMPDGLPGLIEELRTELDKFVATRTKEAADAGPE